MFCTTCSGLFTDPTFDMEVCIWLNSYFWVNCSFKHVDKSLTDLFLFRTTSQTNWQTHLFLLFAATGSKVRTGNNSFYTHHKELLCDPVWKRYQLTTGSGLSARLTRPLYGTSQIVTRRDRGAAAVTEKHYNRLPSRKISNLCVIKQQMPGDLICRYSVCNYRTQRKAANPHILEARMSKCCDFFYSRDVVLWVGLPQINLCDFCDLQTFLFNASSRSKFSLNPVKCLNIQHGERHNVLYRHSGWSFQTPVIPWHFL